MIMPPGRKTPGEKQKGKQRVDPQGTVQPTSTQSTTSNPGPQTSSTNSQSTPRTTTNPAPKSSTVASGSNPRPSRALNRPKDKDSFLTSFKDIAKDFEERGINKTLVVEGDIVDIMLFDLPIHLTSFEYVDVTSKLKASNDHRITAQTQNDDTSLGKKFELAFKNRRVEQDEVYKTAAVEQWLPLFDSGAFTVLAGCLKYRVIDRINRLYRQHREHQRILIEDTVHHLKKIAEHRRDKKLAHSNAWLEHEKVAQRIWEIREKIQGSRDKIGKSTDEIEKSTDEIKKMILEQNVERMKQDVQRMEQEVETLRKTRPAEETLEIETIIQQRYDEDFSVEGMSKWATDYKTSLPKLSCKAVIDRYRGEQEGSHSCHDREQRSVNKVTG